MKFFPQSNDKHTAQAQQQVSHTTHKEHKQNKAQNNTNEHNNMKKTTPTSSSSSSSSSLSLLRRKLKEDGNFYFDNSSFVEARENLLRTLQTNDCREILSVVANGSDLANAFVRASESNHVDLLEAFLDHGINVNIIDTCEWSALMHAAFGDCKESVRLLLDHNAHVDAQQNTNRTTALMAAVLRGLPVIVEMLLQKNANPNIRGSKGVTALMDASRKNYKEIVQILLDHDADRDLTRDDGKTALDLTSSEEIKELLRNHVNTDYVLK